MSVPPDPIDPDKFYPPTVDEVGALLRARTQNDDDDEIGTFDDTTRPTGEEVELIIAQATSIVLGRTGSVDSPPMTCDMAPDIRTNAQTCVTMLAVILIELSYFPEQVRSDRSAYEDYRSLWNDQMRFLIDAAAECRGGEILPDQGGQGQGEGYRYGPSYAFPVDAGGLVGWQTDW
jgi:hypothetical protein